MKINNISVAIEKPTDGQNKLAILCPGYLDNKDYDHLVLLARDLAKEGFLAVRFDPTGTWNSAGKIADYKMTRYLRDIDELINYFEEKNKKAFDQITITGHSFGGQVAIYYGLMHENIAVAIGIMPSFGDFENSQITSKWRKTGFRNSKRELQGESKKFKSFCVPFSFLKDRLKFLEPAVQNPGCKKLFLAGELDDVATPESIKKYFIKIPDPKKMIVLPKIGHDYRRSVEEIKIVNKYIIDNL